MPFDIQLAWTALATFIAAILSWRQLFANSSKTIAETNGIEAQTDQKKSETVNSQLEAAQKLSDASATNSESLMKTISLYEGNLDRLTLKVDSLEASLKETHQKYVEQNAAVAVYEDRFNRQRTEINDLTTLVKSLQDEIGSLRSDYQKCREDSARKDEIIKQLKRENKELRLKLNTQNLND